MFAEGLPSALILQFLDCEPWPKFLRLRGREQVLDIGYSHQVRGQNSASVHSWFSGEGDVNCNRSESLETFSMTNCVLNECNRSQNQHTF